jgi:hypothetical protein
VQLVWHCAEKCALHEAVHWLTLALEEHCALHWDSASAVQLAVQSKVAGWAMQSATQLPLQLAVQVGNGSPLHLPVQFASSSAEHASSKLTGVQFALQPPLISVSHVPCASTLMFPHSAIPARASDVDNKGNEKRATPKANGANGLRVKEFFMASFCCEPS